MMSQTKNFKINPINKQMPVKIEGNNMIFENGNKYSLTIMKIYHIFYLILI